MPLDRPLPNIGNTTEKPMATKTYHIDWESGRITGQADGVDALMQYCQTTLLTPRFRCPIYDGQEGSEHGTLIGSEADEAYIAAELPRMVADALRDERILAIADFKQEKRGDGRYVEFTVKSIYGEFIMGVTM